MFAIDMSRLEFYLHCFVWIMAFYGLFVLLTQVLTKLSKNDTRNN